MNNFRKELICQIGLEMCNLCLEIAKPGSVDSSYVKGKSRNKLLALLSNDLVLLKDLLQKDADKEINLGLLPNDAILLKSFLQKDADKEPVDI